MSSVDISHKRGVRQCFDRAAPHYDQYSQVQQRIGQRLIELLMPHCKECSIVIDLGCGTGLITAGLANILKSDEIHLLDISETMLQHAKQALSLHTVKAHQMDFENVSSLEKRYSLVFSNMSLHWSLQIANVFDQIYQVLDKEGLLCFSLPIKGTLHELQQVSINSMHSVHQIGEWLRNSGFRILYMTTGSITTSYASPIEAMRSIKLTGANWTMNKSTKGLRGREYFNTLYTQYRSANFSLTYNIAYFIAKKSHEQ